MNLILTLATGSIHQAIFEETSAHMRGYAKRIKADFKAVQTDDASFKTMPAYQKLKIIHDFLKDYDRVCFVDADVLISEKAPDIFEAVPQDRLGLFNEAPWVGERHTKDVGQWKVLTGFELEKGSYFNTGVIVASKEHRHLFDLETFKHKINFYGEQTAFNQHVQEHKPQIFELSYKWNRMTCTWLKGLTPYNSHFVHFAGVDKTQIIPMIRNVREDWKANGYEGKDTVFIVAGGGMGNQIATLPTVKEIMRLYPDSQIGIRSSYPQVFKHLESERVQVARIPTGDEASQVEHADLERKFQFARVIPTYRPTEYNMTQMNSVDYHSLVALGRQLEDRTIEFPFAELETPLPPNTICIHAGKNGWKSKDVPKELYQDVCEQLQNLGYKIAIIGKKDFSEHGQGYGAFRLEGADFDFLDCSLETAAAVINQSVFLFSNDSAPVHLAGATETPIGILSIAKHPSLIAPYRKKGRSIGFVASEGKNQWELAPSKPFWRPDEKVPTVADWVEGMEWPKASFIVERIRECLTSTK